MCFQLLWVNGDNHCILQDTVIGIHALASLEVQTGEASGGQNLRLSVMAGNEDFVFETITEANKDILQVKQVWYAKGLGANSLWPSGAIWCHGSLSTLVQVMPVHYLNWCQLIISKTFGNILPSNENENTANFIQQNANTKWQPFVQASMC